MRKDTPAACWGLEGCWQRHETTLATWLLRGSVGFDRGMFEKDILGLGTSKGEGLTLGKEGMEMERLGPERG